MIPLTQKTVVSPEAFRTSVRTLAVCLYEDIKDISACIVFECCYLHTQNRNEKVVSFLTGFLGMHAYGNRSLLVILITTSFFLEEVKKKKKNNILP